MTVQRYRTTQWQRIRDEKRTMNPCFSKHLREIGRRRQIAFQRLMASTEGNPVWVEFKKVDQGQWAFILPDLEGTYAFRVQSFDQDGFIGHTCYRSLQEAAEELVASGYCVMDRGALSRESHTVRWAIGVKRQELRLLFSRGKIGWQEMQAAFEAVVKSFQGGQAA